MPYDSGETIRQTPPYLAFHESLRCSRVNTFECAVRVMRIERAPTNTGRGLYVYIFNIMLYIYIYKEFHVSRTCLISLNAVACAANVEHEHGRSDQQVSHLRPLSYRWRYGQSRNYIVRSTPIHKGAVNVAAQTSVGPFRKSKDGVWRVPRHGQVGKLEWSASFSGWTIHANTSHNTWKKFNYGSQTCKTGIRLVAFKSSRKAVCV